MDRNVRIARELVRIAREIAAFGIYRDEYEKEAEKIFKDTAESLFKQRKNWTYTINHDVREELQCGVWFNDVDVNTQNVLQKAIFDLFYMSCGMRMINYGSVELAFVRMCGKKNFTELTEEDMTKKPLAPILKFIDSCGFTRTK